tara:strand:+ start:879 stop:3674 length:2796 start_codon:yes stop_codon:yes gene_type:complete
MEKLPKYIYWDNIDSNELLLFIRDLSEKIDINVKNLIDDVFNNKKDEKIKKLKKKDIIIQKQNEKRYSENILKDFKKIEYFINNFITEDIYNNLYNIKTKEGKIEYKCQVLHKLWNMKKKNMKLILTLYFQIVKEKKYTVRHEYLITSIRNKFTKKDYDFQLYMLKELGDILYPLNYWDNPEKKLEDWQKNVLLFIKQNKSILVKAPTSSGKSLIALSSGIIYKKILYVCPSIPVVYQVGSHFKKLDKKVQFILEDYENNININKDVYIGTPKYIENYLYKIGNNFDYAVFDEIHNLNNDEGDIYENIIKLINCNFVALSATINNINFLKDIFNKIHNKNIELIEYNKRFINNQKWLWNNNKLIKINPISCLDKSNIDKLLKSNITFTPNDSALIYDSLDEIIEDYDNDLLDDILFDISPSNVFSNYSNEDLLTLDDTKLYEEKLKEGIVNINNIDNTVISKLIDNYKITYNPIIDKKSIISMFREVKNNNMLPMLVFNPDINICENLFYYLYNELHNKELIDNPYYYLILEKKDKLYNEYISNRENFINNIKVGKSNNSKNIVNDKVDNFDKNEKNKFITIMIQYYNSCIDKIKKSDDVNKINQLKNIKKELEEFINNSDFSKQDIFKKHIDYCFTNKEPMDENSIRNIRREIYKTLGFKISYENPIFQMLKRGIGIYTENMPRQYKWIIQKLLSNKLIGIVITDRTLCQGIDLPIKTSCIYGTENNNFTQDDILQMSGRAGRRGHDTSGNVIYYNIPDYSKYIFNNNPEIIGSENTLYSNYNILNKISNINTDNVFKNIINPNRKIIDKTCYFDNNIINWLIRNYSINFGENKIKLIQLDILKCNNSFEKEIILLNIFSNKYVIDIYKKNIIDKDINFNMILLKKITEILLIFYNNLSKDYLEIKKILFIVFKNIKNIILKHNPILKFS